MPRLVVPPEVEAVFQQVRTCEFTTLAKDHTPITWPTVALYEPARGRFVITTSIGLPHKAYNLRRTPRVAMLYSDPTGSGLAAPPAVLVQGNATCPDQVLTQSHELDTLGRLIMVRQPVSARYSANRLTRWLSDWYLMRLLIFVTPRRIRWWPHGDFSAAPVELEVDHVEIARRLPRFASAVLTGLDRDGDPVSLRCQPALDHHAQVLRVGVPDGLGMVAGPAGLLCHHHDEQLWGLRSFLLRGTLEQTGHGWLFRPRQLVPGMDTTVLSNLRLLRTGRRTAKRYLATRGLRRPTIPWDHYQQLKEQAQAEAALG